MSTPIEKLPLHAAEGGNYPVQFSFYDENEEKVLPNAATVSWKLFNKSGTQLATADLSSALDMVILLKGDHLSVSGTPDKYESRDYDTSVPLYYRRLYAEGQVNSDLGSDIPITKEWFFYIEGLMGVADADA